MTRIPIPGRTGKLKQSGVNQPIGLLKALDWICEQAACVVKLPCSYSHQHQSLNLNKAMGSLTMQFNTRHSSQEIHIHHKRSQEFIHHKRSTSKWVFSRVLREPGLTCGYLLLASTRLSIASTKAAVLPVPDWDWAIRFCGLRPRTRASDTHTHTLHHHG